MTDTHPPPTATATTPTLSQNDSLRDALSLIIADGCPDPHRHGGRPPPVGLLTLDHIRECAVIGDEVN